MKKITLIFLALFVVSAYGQKKKNGTIYVDHPAIKVVEDLHKAFVAGDAEKAGSYLAEEFRSFNGVEDNKDAKGGTKEDFMNQVTAVAKNWSYMSIERSSGAYPDALEYKDGNNDDVVWVQTWDHFKAVHNRTGVKLDQPFHRLYVVNKDNEILTLINYTNSSVFDEIGDSRGARENGTIYNHHKYINNVRRLVAAIEFGDVETQYSFFAENAQFTNIHMPLGESISMEEDKEGMKNFRAEFDITSIDVRGYPDYLNYGIGNSKVVQSWWTVRLVRKSDKKKINLPLMFMHSFNDDGKITREVGYFSLQMLEAK